MKKGQLIGIALLLVIFASVYVIKTFFLSAPEAQVVLKGRIGGEKISFIENEEVKDILLRKYGIVVEYAKAGSIEMVTGDIEGLDFLWPSSQVALEIFKLRRSDKLVKSDIIFNSPIVLYSWDIVADALRKKGIVKEEDNANYVVNFPKLIDMIRQGQEWKDIGLSELYGKMSIISTDPTKSNSGNMFFGLLANLINKGDVVNESSVDNILPKVKDFYDRLGYLEHSSSDLFSQYLQTGVGAKPIIVGYENQIIEFSLQNRDVWPSVKDKIAILYPVPTVWSAHPLITLSEKANILLKALQDEEIKRIAWESHGFRTGMMGAQNDPGVLKVAGIPASIRKVIPMPKARIMDLMVRFLKGEVDMAGHDKKGANLFKF